MTRDEELKSEERLAPVELRMSLQGHFEIALPGKHCFHLPHLFERIGRL
jgi:hypothetical protein